MTIGYNNVQGFGLAKQHQMKVILDNESFDIFAITESKRNDDYPVTEISKDYTWIGKNRTENSGGGIGLLYNSKKMSPVNLNLLNSMDDAYERMWSSFSCGNDTIALGITYFPVDNQTKSADSAQALQAELIENIAKLQQDFSNIILIGDFNGKVTTFSGGKPSSNGVLIEGLVESTNFNVLNESEKCSGKITWHRNSQSSTIDYVLCSDDMLHSITSMVIDEDQHVSVGSDHYVIILKANFSAKHKPTSTNETNVPIEKWNIRDTTDWDTFGSACDELFSKWNYKGYDNVSNMWVDFKDKLRQAGKTTIGYKKFGSKRAFWDKEVDLLINNRKKANRLYRIWSSHSHCSPELLQTLWDDYRDKKRKVSEHIKHTTMVHKINVITKNAAKASKNPRAYWNMLRKFNKSSGYPLRIQNPENPNEIVDDPIEIKNILTNYWANLGKSNKDKNKDEIADVDKLKYAPPSPEALKTIRIDEDSLKKAINSLQNGKATGVDKIPGEFIKYGGKSLFNAFLYLLSIIKVTETMPDEWFEGIVKPLLKAGNKEDLNNYRGITISCVAYKVLVKIIETQVTGYCETNNLFGEYQGAFRKGRRCEDNLFSLKGICAIRKSKKQNTYLAYLDISKAFDTLDRDKLFIHVWNKGIQDKVWRLIKMLYQKVDNKVIFGSFESELFQVDTGVKQGCILSPTLFNLVTTDLENMLDSCHGVPLGETAIKGLYYADDIVLLATNGTQLQSMLDLAHQFASKWGLKFNKVKSQVMVIGKRLSDKQWRLGEEYIKETNTYKYLGVMMNRQLNDSNHIKDHLSSKMDKFKSHIRYVLAKHADINRVSFGTTLWQKVTLPSISHAAGIWFNPTKQSRSSLESFQYQVAKAVLKIRCTPSITATIGELGWLPIKHHLDILRVSYYAHLQNMPEDRLPKMVLSELQKLGPNKNSSAFNYVKQIQIILSDKGLDHLVDNLSPVQTFKRFTSQCYNTSFFEDISTRSSLIHYRFLKEDTHLSKYLLNNGPFRPIQLKFKLRTGVCGLGEDYFRQKRGSGFCTCGAFETLKHFLLLCPHFNDIRKAMFNDIKRLCGDDIFNLMISSQDYAIKFLMGDHDNILNCLCLSYLDKAWTRRCDFIS